MHQSIDIAHKIKIQTTISQCFRKHKGQILKIHLARLVHVCPNTKENTNWMPEEIFGHHIWKEVASAITSTLVGQTGWIQFPCIQNSFKTGKWEERGLALWINASPSLWFTRIESLTSFYTPLPFFLNQRKYGLQSFLSSRGKSYCATGESYPSALPYESESLFLGDQSALVLFVVIWLEGGASGQWYWLLSSLQHQVIQRGASPIIHFQLKQHHHVAWDH